MIDSRPFAVDNETYIDLWESILKIMPHCRVMDGSIFD